MRVLFFFNTDSYILGCVSMTIFIPKLRDIHHVWQYDRCEKPKSLSFIEASSLRKNDIMVKYWHIILIKRAIRFWQIYQAAEIDHPLLCIRYDNNLLTLGMLEIYINQEIKHIFCHSLQTHPPSFSVMLGRYSTYINPHSLLCTIEFLYSYQLTWATVLGARVAWQLFGGEFRATNLRFPLLCLVILLVIGFRFLQWCCQLMMKYMPP